MNGLFSSLRVGLKSLNNMQTAMSVVNENVANVNTPGYSRKEISFKPGPEQVYSFGTLGSGADVEAVTSVRDKFLDKRILAELDEQGLLTGQQAGLQQIEMVLAGGEGAGLGDQLSRVFNSFLELSADPSSTVLRQGVISEAQTLANSIQTTAYQLDSLYVDNQSQISGSVDKVNALMEDIAALNKQLDPILAQGQDGGLLMDQRQQMLEDLAGEIGILSYTSESGSLTVTTTSGKLLVSGSESFSLEAEDSSSGMVVRQNGQDISSELTGGRLGGYLSLQNSILPSYQNALNDFTSALVAEVNQLHQSGEGLDGSTGLNFFNVTPGAEADTISVAITNPDSIAAAPQGGAAGDGTIAQQIADLRDENFAGLGDETLHGFYSQLIFQSGLDVQRVNNSISSQDSILHDLELQRASVSGVSLDEEAVKLLQFQRAYQASSRLIQVIDQLLEETIAMVR